MSLPIHNYQEHCLGPPERQLPIWASQECAQRRAYLHPPLRSHSYGFIQLVSTHWGRVGPPYAHVRPPPPPLLPCGKMHMMHDRTALVISTQKLVPQPGTNGCINDPVLFWFLASMELLKQTHTFKYL